MAMPTVVSVGTVLQTTSSGTPGIPSGTASGDVLYLYISCTDGAPGVSGGNQTWAQVANSPVDEGGDCRLYCYWARRGATAPTAPTVTAPESGIAIARMLAVNGAPSSGDPWHLSVASTEASSDTSWSATGGTTTVADCLVLVAGGGWEPEDITTGTAEFSAWTNANLSSITERIDNAYEWSTYNFGSVLGVASGGKASAGAIGSTTFSTVRSSYKAMLVLAISQGTTPVDGPVLDLKWDLQKQVDGSVLDLKYDLQGAVNGNVLDLKWDLQKEVNGPALDLVWDLEPGAVNGPELRLKWDIGGLEPVDGPELDLVWDLAAQVSSAPLDLVWDLAVTHVEGREHPLASTIAAEIVVDPTATGFAAYIASLYEDAGTGADAAGIGTLAWSNPSNATGPAGGGGATCAIGTSTHHSDPIYGDPYYVDVDDSETQTGSVVDEPTGMINWTAPSNAAVQDGNYAIAGLTYFNNVSDRLRMYNAGFSSVQGTVTGVRARLRRKAENGNKQIQDLALWLTHGNADPISQNKASGANWGASAATISYGGAGDLWSTGSYLTPSVVRSSGFGFVASAKLHAVTGGDIAEVDMMDLTVYYTYQEEHQDIIGYDEYDTFTDESTHYLKLTDFGFSIPSDAEIVGIRVLARCQRTTKTDANGTWTEPIHDAQVSLIKGGTIQSTNKAMSATWATSYSTRSYGGSADLWNGSWTYSDINSSGFGVAIAAVGGPATADVDSVQIIVYYTVEGEEVAVAGAPAVRFSPDETDAGRVPQSTSFSTDEHGYSAASMTVVRPKQFSARDYIMGFARIYEYESNTTLYEGRIVGTADSGRTVTLEMEGYAKAFEDNRTVRFVGMDRDFGHWGSASIQYKLDELGSGFMVSEGGMASDPTIGEPALEQGIDSPWDTSAYPEVASVYASPTPIGYLDFAWKQSGNFSGGNWFALLSDDDLMSSTNSSGDLAAAGPGHGTVTASGATKKYAIVKFSFGSAADTTNNAHYAIYWTLLGVVGNHGIALQGTLDDPNTGRGLLGSDVFSYIVDTYVPQLELGVIEESTFAIPHLVFLDPTTPGDIAEGIRAFGNNSYYPMDWWVGSGRKVHLTSPENRGQTWRVRYDSGTEAQDSGPDVQQMINGVVVAYDDGTGTKYTVGPPGSGADSEDATLADTSSTNPINRDGAPHWEYWDASITSPAGALLLGQLVLAERNRQDWRGSVTIRGWAVNENGIPMPASMIQTGDSIVIEDDEDTRPRRISSTSYDGAARSLECSIGAQPDRLDVILARLGIVLVGKL